MPLFYTDHNVSLRLVRFMRDAGHDITSARESGLEQAHDPAQLLTAVERDRVLLTHNESDFLLLHEAWFLWARAWGVTARHPGIIVLPQQEQWHPARSTQEIEAVMAASDSLGNRMWLWRSSRGWIPLVWLSGDTTARDAPPE